MRFRMMACALAATLVSGCGGGGGSTATSASTSSVEVDAARAPVGQTLTITKLNLKTSDVIARTASSQSNLQVAWARTRAILEGVVTKAVPSAYAQSYPVAFTAQSIPVSRKLINGQLFKLDPKVVYLEKDAAGNLVERTITCDLSAAEVNIKAAHSLDTLKGHLVLLMDVPATVQAGCQLTYRPGIFIVLDSGATYEVTASLPGGLTNVIAANDPGFNQSVYPLLISGPLVKTLEVTDSGNVLVRDLTASSAPVLTTSPGSLAFNGRYLLAASSPAIASSATFLMFEKESTAFRIFRPGDTEPTAWNTNGYLSAILDHSGRFLFHYASSPFQVLQPQDLSFSPMTASGFPMSMYGAVGRHGRWVMSDRGVLWNYETGQAVHLLGAATMTAPFSSPAYARLMGNHAYIVDKDMATFTRYDVDTGRRTAVNIIAAGYLPRAFRIYKDQAVVEVVNTTNSDRKYVAIDFATEQISDLGVIAQGIRKVDEFVPIGGPL